VHNIMKYKKCVRRSSCSVRGGERLPAVAARAAVEPDERKHTNKCLGQIESSKGRTRGLTFKTDKGTSLLYLMCGGAVADLSRPDSGAAVPARA